MNTPSKYSKLIARILSIFILFSFIGGTHLIITSIKEVLIEYSSNETIESNSRVDSDSDNSKEKSVEWTNWKEISKQLIEVESTNTSKPLTTKSQDSAKSTDDEEFCGIVLDKSKLIDLSKPISPTKPKEVVEEPIISEEIEIIEPEWSAEEYYEPVIQVQPLGLSYEPVAVVETEPLPYTPEESKAEETAPISTEATSTITSEVTNVSEVTSISETTESTTTVTEETTVTEPEPEDESWYYPTLYAGDGSTTTWEKENQAILKKYCDQYNVDYELMLAVISKESGYNQYATSYCGAMGLCQVMPITVQQFYIDTGYYPNDVYSVEDNIHVGVHTMAACLNKFGNMYDACCAYANGLYSSCVGGYSSYAESAIAQRDRILALK